MRARHGRPSPQRPVFRPLLSRRQTSGPTDAAASLLPALRERNPTATAVPAAAAKGRVAEVRAAAEPGTDPAAAEPGTDPAPAARARVELAQAQAQARERVAK